MITRIRFKVSELTNDLNGSEDDQIIVFKENKCRAGTLPKLTEQIR